jgi:hypothetical protein
VSDDEGRSQPDLSAFGDESDADGASTETSEGGETDGEGETSEGDDSTGLGVADASTTDVTELDRSERVELGVELVAHLEAEELSLAAVVDRIETVTTNPSLTREILDAAELRGVIERDGGRIRTRRGGTFVRFESQVVEREGDFDCRRCGAGLSTGHFVRFESGELGPFGSSCVRKVLGRE